MTESRNPHIGALFEALIDDAAMFPPGNAIAAEAVTAHREYRTSWFAAMIGPLVVEDRRLAEVGRAAGDQPVEVSVVNTSGAGGIVSLAQRQIPQVKIVAVESALRDLDDLVSNAARVASAAGALDESVRVFVEIPFAPGWERAVEEVEAAGLLGKIRTGGVDLSLIPTARQLARQLSVLIEADLAFKATAGLHHAWPHSPQHGFANVLVAVEALVEGASEDDAAELLTINDPERLIKTIGAWSDGQSRRIRRRFRSFGCCGVLDPVNDLVSAGLLAVHP